MTGSVTVVAYSEYMERTTILVYGFTSRAFCDRDKLVLLRIFGMLPVAGA